MNVRNKENRESLRIKEYTTKSLAKIVVMAKLQPIAKKKVHTSKVCIIYFYPTEALLQRVLLGYI